MPVNSNIHPLMIYVVFEEQGLMIICFCNICLVNIGHEIFAIFSMEIFRVFYRHIYVPYHVYLGSNFPFYDIQIPNL